MFELSENMSAGQPVEAVIGGWFTEPGWQVRQVSIVPPGEGMLDEVAYVLAEQGALGIQRVWVVFLKRYEKQRLVGYVCREEEFPAAFSCPQSLLEMLGPTSDARAQRWRLQCWLRVRGVRSGERLAWTCDLPWGGIKSIE